MTIRTWVAITGEADYIEALSAVLKTWRAMPGTTEYQERHGLLLLIRDYEQKNGIRQIPGKEA